MKMTGWIRIIFYTWYIIGLSLLLTVGVPSVLDWSNGLFLIFYMIYSLRIFTKTNRLKGFPLTALALAICTFTFFIEFVGTRTGIPFGRYEYSNVLGFIVASIPLTVALAWVGIVVNLVVAFADLTNRWIRALAVGFSATLFDLVLDPVAHVRSFWSWEPNQFGAFYDVPLANFVSWFILFAIISLLFPMRIQANPSVQTEAIHLYQAMVAMFGALSLVDSLYGASMFALITVIALEWRRRHVLAQSST